MNIEQKAKAYDEALEKARMYRDNAKAVEYYAAVARYENIFPELRESEDERIRKELLDFVRSFWTDHKEKLPQTSRWVTYLEKQKEFSEHGYGLYYYHNGGLTFVGRPAEEEKQKEQSLRDFIDDFPYSDEQKEQKPEKVLYIPKFRTGDLVRSSKNPRLTYKIFSVGSMNELGNSEYEVEIFTDGKPDEPRNLKHMEIEKMDSWGELVKQTPAEWSEDIIQKAVKEVGLTQRQIDWFKTNVFPPKPEWSEEDERIREALYKHFSVIYPGDSKFRDTKLSNRQITDFLKSLRPSWKPSEEEIEAVRYFVNKHQSEAWAATGQWKQFTALRGLLGNLMKLM